VYIDTSVIIPALHPATESMQKRVSAFFLDVEQGKYTGVISDLCRLEYCAYLKGIIAMLPGHSGKVTRADIDVGLDKYDQLLEEYGLEEVSADALLSEPFIADCMELISKSVATPNEDGEWLFFGGADCLHAILAARCGVGFLATMDEGYRALRDSVQPMVLWDKY
jgi:predicted nucleic acid-binding protein